MGLILHLRRMCMPTSEVYALFSAQNDWKQQGSDIICRASRGRNLFSVFQCAVLLKVIFQSHFLFANLAKAFNKDQIVVLPRSLNRLIGREVGLLALAVSLTFFPSSWEKQSVLLIHQDTLSVHFVLFEHSDISLKQVEQLKFSKSVKVAVTKLADVFHITWR